MNAGAAALLFGLGALAASSISYVTQLRHPPADPAAVRAQALADARWEVHAARLRPVVSGPDSFYHGCITAAGLIEALPGFDPDVDPAAVLAYKTTVNPARDTAKSGRIGDGPGGVGSTSTGPNPHTATDGSEG